MNQQEEQLVSYWHMKFKESMVAKAPYTKDWTTYFDAYNGDYFKNKNRPEYKSDLVSNFVFSTIETIRPIMLDNDPKFQSMPRHPKALDYANSLQSVLTYEWDREDMNVKLYRELIRLLVIGNIVLFVPWDAKGKNVRSIPVNPFNLFPDPLATSVEDAEFLIYANYKNVNQLKESYPEKAKQLSGGGVNYSELVSENNRSAVNITNQVLVLEVYTRDYNTYITGEDGKVKRKYPYGRVLTIAPELGVLLEDKALPYKDGKFPFLLIKDYDVPGKFWGEGEVAQLLSPQKYINELNNAIIDNAKTTANMPWIVDKNAGIPEGAITSIPGLIIRKNSGSEVRREQPAQMPGYVLQTVESLKNDIEQISGVFDSVKGNSETGVYTAQGILALQEAGQARIRLKVKLLEDGLGKLATLWYYRMKQFWNEDRYFATANADGSFEVSLFKTETFAYDYDIKITAGSTMPVNRGAMLDLMVRLAQTPMPDGQNLVDREAVMTYLPDEVKAATLKRMDGTNTQLQQQVEEMQQQFTQALEENQANDQQTIETLQNVAKTIKYLQEKILQIENDNDKIKEEEKLNEIRKEGYNSGYSDAESLTSFDADERIGDGLYDEEQPQVDMEGLGEDMDESVELPNEVYQGIENLSEDELAVLMEQNPELGEMI